MSGRVRLIHIRMKQSTHKPQNCRRLLLDGKRRGTQRPKSEHPCFYFIPAYCEDNSIFSRFLQQVDLFSFTERNYLITSRIILKLGHMSRQVLLGRLTCSETISMLNMLTSSQTSSALSQEQKLDMEALFDSLPKQS